MLNAISIAEKISVKVSKNLNLDKEKEQVIGYGIFSIVQIVFNLILVWLIGFMFGVAIEALIVSFTVGILRKSTGGAHSSSPNVCIIIGTIVCITIGMISKSNIKYNEIIFLSIITFIGAYYIVLKLAPVDSLAKPIRTDKKKKRLKKSSIFTLNLYLLIITLLLCIYIYIGSNKLINYSVSILGGVIWQVVSLTKVGHKFVKLIDSFFYIIINRGIKK